MSIHNSSNSSGTHPRFKTYKNPDGTIMVEISRTNMEIFAKMIARAMNTWDTAPANLKILHDEILFGAALQAYENMTAMRPREELTEVESFQLDAPRISKVQAEESPKESKVRDSGE